MIRNNMTNFGFTLIELMVVIAIITILSTMALPSFQDRIIRSQVKEAFQVASVVQQEVADFYKIKGHLPENNTMAGLPAPEKLVGNYLSKITVDKGVINITLGNRVNKNVLGKTVTIRPAIVEDAPLVPVAWVFAYATVPGGMAVVGENTSSVLPRHLPVFCRY